MAEDRLTIAINLANGAVSQYTNYDFNSYAVRHGNTTQLYGTNSDGLHLLESASTDNGTSISCYLQTMKMGLSELYQTNLLRGYINYRATDDLSITSTADGWDTAYTETVTNYITAGTWHSDDFPIDTGAWGSQWQWKVANVDGGDLSVKSMHAVTAARQQIPIFNGVSGINTRTDPALISYNPRTGIQEMSELVNMYVDNSLHAHRRRGYTEIVDGNFHSLFCGPGQKDAYAVLDSGGAAAIYRIAPNNAGQLVTAGLTGGRRVWWTWYDGKAYWSNGLQNGYIIGGTAYSWTLSSPHASEYDGSREYYAPPTGTIMTTFSGRIYMAQGDTVWESEWGSPNRWRKSVGFMRFEGQITMLESVMAGMYVSDNVRTYFVSPADTSGAMRLDTVAEYPAVLGTSAVTEGGRVMGGQAMRGPVAVWTSTQGICVGDQKGQLINLTDSKFTYPVSDEGSAMVMNVHGESPGMPVLYIVSLAA